ncbi:unnamed protein product [Microthlaspi erraticum]|uniref:Uncharacterized protein n=1 Tax=Microthlaspi erraticum TaxID=1685480 RepID=A0A6D2IIQ8_9BRAS|nr:unnamed protein product [Microthlaspi erraticum]
MRKVLAGQGEFQPDQPYRSTRGRSGLCSAGRYKMRDKSFKQHARTGGEQAALSQDNTRTDRPYRSGSKRFPSAKFRVRPKIRPTSSHDRDKNRLAIDPKFLGQCK